MDYLYIEKLAGELHSHLSKERIGEVLKGEKELSFRVGRFYLNFYWGNPNALFLGSSPIGRHEFPPLMKLKGAFVKSVSLPVVDRVLEFELVKPLPGNRFSRFFLIFELTGKNANLFLLNEERKITFLLRSVESSVRPLSTGDRYLFPPSDKKPFEELQFGKVTPEGVEKKLYRFVAGISPLNAREIAYLMKELGSLEEAYKKFMELHRNSQTAYLYYQNGKPKFLTTFPYKSLSQLEFKEFSGSHPYSSAWEEFYRKAIEERRIATLKEKIVSRIEKKIEALKKELEELSDLEKLRKEAERWKRWGELLKYNLHLVKPGQKEVKVTDFSTGREETVPLDPALSPKENLNRFFKKYRKALKRLEFAENRLEEIKQELERAELLKETVISKEKAEDLEVFTPGGTREITVPDFLTFTLPSGRRIFVGRNASENEFLSLKLANPWDFWFHAKEVPGSHVILRLGKGEEPSEEDILLSAAAAAYFSKGRESGKVKVDYTRVKNLKKPPKTPKGFVIYSREKTVVVSPELFKERVEREAPRGGR